MSPWILGSQRLFCADAEHWWSGCDLTEVGPASPMLDGVHAASPDLNERSEPVEFNSPILEDFVMDGTVVVVGSINADTVLTMDKLPHPGETILATGSVEFLGGKGHAQALAAARFGSRCLLIGAVGDDDAARRVREGLTQAGVDLSLLRTVREPTGRAFVSVDASGENSIVVLPGANAAVDSLTPTDVAAIGNASVLLLQLENGTSAAFNAIRTAHAAGVTVVLNAAPAREIPDDVINCVSYLIVNEGEARLLGGSDDLREVGEQLSRKVGTVLVTVGAGGVNVYERDSTPYTITAEKVRVIDTTGAGDSFCGVFAAALAQGVAVRDACQFAVTAGTRAVQTAGNTSSIASRAEILADVARIGGAGQVHRVTAV
jgi:ribokinase